MSEANGPRRRHPRISLNLPVHISSIDPERDHRTGRPYFRASRELCANVSPGGAYLRTADPLSPGRRVLIELPLPGGRSVEAVGRVAWSRTVVSPRGLVESGCGIEFVGATGEAHAFLSELVERGPTEGVAPG